MPDPFQIVSGPESDKVVVLRVSGNLDSTTSTELARHCAELARPDRSLVLNLQAVGFIASSGVGALLATAERLLESGGSLHLVALSPPVESVIHLLNLESFLQIHDTEDDAVETLKAA
jgi:stage II sporulation protein AA (anti-sigma F factor antagonist)